MALVSILRSTPYLGGLISVSKASAILYRLRAETHGMACLPVVFFT